MYTVYDIRYPIYSPALVRSDTPCRAPGFKVRVSGFGSWIAGFEFRVSGFGFRVSGCGLRVAGFGFRVSGFKFRGSFCFGGGLLRPADFGARVQDHVDHVSGPC